MTDSIIPGSIGNIPLPGLIPKLMRVSSCPSDVHFFLSVGQHREVILIIKSGVDHFFIAS